METETKTNRGSTTRKQWRIICMLPWPALREFVSGALIAIGELPSDGRPDWAVKAARRACIDVFGLPKSAKRKSPDFELGHMMTFLRGLERLEQKQPAVPNDVKQSQWFLEFMGQMAPLRDEMGRAAFDDPTFVEDDFFQGTASGQQASGSIAASHTAAFYFALGAKWREILEFRNMSQLHDWLLEHELISRRHSDLRNTRKLCSQLGLRFADKGGRPPKQKPYTSSRS
jgi:hypothetical protein